MTKAGSVITTWLIMKLESDVDLSGKSPTPHILVSLSCTQAMGQDLATCPNNGRHWLTNSLTNEPTNQQAGFTSTKAFIHLKPACEYFKILLLYLLPPVKQVWGESRLLRCHTQTLNNDLLSINSIYICLIVIVLKNIYVFYHQY